MENLFYSTGKAARELGTSQEQIRDLCAADRIATEISAGGQWRIPKREVERLKRDGLPPLPRPLPGDNARMSGANTRSAHSALLAEPSREVVEAAEEVVVLENEVKAIGLRRQREEALDWFRGRDEQQADREWEKEEGERRRTAQARAGRLRVERLNRWLKYALASVPSEAPPEVELEVHRQVRDVLGEIDLVGESDVVLQSLVDAAVATVVKPWKRQVAIERIITDAVNRLPSEICNFHEPTVWQQKAAQAARRAVAELGSEASLPEVQAVAHRTVDGITGGYEHGKAVADLASWARLRLPHGVTSEEREDAERAVTAALSALPVGTSRRDLERARDAALVPVMEGILRRATAEAQERQQREDQAARKAVANAWWSLPLGLSEEVRQKALAEIGKAIDALPACTPRAELEQTRDTIIERFTQSHELSERVVRLVDAGLLEIYPYIMVLEQDWEFDKSTSALEAELREPVRIALHNELKGAESPEDVTRRVRRLVRGWLGIR